MIRSLDIAQLHTSNFTKSFLSYFKSLSASDLQRLHLTSNYHLLQIFKIYIQCFRILNLIKNLMYIIVKILSLFMIYPTSSILQIIKLRKILSL